MISMTEGRGLDVKTHSYGVMLTWDADDKMWNVSVPAIPGCFTFGVTVDEAIANAREAILVNVEDMAERGEPIPAEDTRIEMVTIEAKA